MRIPSFIFLIGIVLFALYLRLYHVNWDQGFHLHPDERAIVLFTLPLQFSNSFKDFFSQQSSWNPHFFAYGSFPLYLLKTVGIFGSFFDTKLAGYKDIVLIGRILSAMFDTGTIIIFYYLIKKLFSKKLALVTSFFYAISVLPIQLSHFYAVDTILTFFISFLLYQLIRFYEHPTKQKAIGIGIVLGFALATKTSATVLFIPILISIAIDFILIFSKQPHKSHIWFPYIPIYFRRLLIEGSLILIGTTCTFFILEPYAFIDFSEFWRQTLQQSEMTKSAFTFPYTLQYVGKISYLYELRNSMLWGLGPVLGISFLIGLLWYHIDFFQKKLPHIQKNSILLSFFWIYFLIVGSFAVGFMRYMLPLYPFFCFFAAYFIYNFFLFMNKKFLLPSYVFLALFLSIILIWPSSFLSLYQKSPTRLTATMWILQTIPPNKTLAIEHWDDALPLFGQERYRVETLELYNQDSNEKWQKINAQLSRSDYLILASNRLYVPLQKLTHCKELPLQYCYTKTAAYYKKLFSEKLGFREVAEFSVYPTIPFVNIPINDDTADESFTVYDHPKILIFKR